MKRRYVNNGKQKMKLLAKSLAKDMIRRDMKKWPPDCLGLTYQPMRPMRHNELDSKTEADRHPKDSNT